MSNLHRTGSHRHTHLAELLPPSNLRAKLAAIGARTETCKHGVTYRSLCHDGCDYPQTTQSTAGA